MPAALTVDRIPAIVAPTLVFAVIFLEIMPSLIPMTARLLGLATTVQAGIFTSDRSQQMKDKINMSPVTYGSYIQFKSTIQELNCSLQGSNAFEINMPGTGSDSGRRFVFCSTPDSSPGEADNYTFEAGFIVAPVIEGIDFLRPTTQQNELPRSHGDSGQIVNCGDEIMLVRNGDQKSEFVVKDHLNSLLTDSPGVSSMSWSEIKDELRLERARLKLKCVHKKDGERWTMNDQISLLSMDGEYLQVIHGGRGYRQTNHGRFHRGNCPGCPHHGSYDTAFVKESQWPIPSQVFTCKAISYVEATDSEKDESKPANSDRDEL